MGFRDVVTREVRVNDAKCPTGPRLQAKAGIDLNGRPWIEGSDKKIYPVDATSEGGKNLIEQIMYFLSILNSGQ